MPKINPKPHAVAVARKLLGLTQEGLAEKCGYAAITIKNVEGRTPKPRPSVQIAGRIMWVTGLDVECILDDTAATIKGLPYSSELGKKYMSLMATRSKTGEVLQEAQIKELMSEWGAVLSAVMVAAARKNALMAIGQAFTDWAESVVHDFKLGPRLEEISAPADSNLKRLQVKSKRMEESKKLELSTEIGRLKEEVRSSKMQMSKYMEIINMMEPSKKMEALDLFEKLKNEKTRVQ